MHERSWASIQRGTLLMHHPLSLAVDGAAGGCEQLPGFLQPRVRIAAVPRIAVLMLLNAATVLPMPRRAPGQTIALHPARRLCGADNIGCETQQAG